MIGKRTFTSCSISSCETAKLLVLSMFHRIFSGCSRIYPSLRRKLTTQLFRFSCCRNLHRKIFSIKDSFFSRLPPRQTLTRNVLPFLRSLMHSDDKLFFSQFKCEAKFFPLFRDTAAASKAALKIRQTLYDVAKSFNMTREKLIEKYTGRLANDV